VRLWTFNSGQVVEVSQLEAEEHIRVNRSRFHPPRLHLHQGWLRKTIVYQLVVRHSSVDAAMDVELLVGFVSGRDATAGIIHSWRTVSH